MSSVEVRPFQATGEGARRVQSLTDRTWLMRALIGFLFVGLVVLMIRPSPRSLSDSFPDLGDPVLNSWTLSWSSHALVTDPLHLFDANIFWPHGYSLAYTDTPFVLLPAFAVLRLLGASEPLAFNLISLGLLALALGATYSLSRWITRRTDAALIAAVAYAFSGYTFAHSPHINMLLLGFIPLAFLQLFRLLEERTTRRGVLLGLINLAVLLGSLYYAAIYVVCAAVMLICYLVAKRFRPGSGLARPLFVALGITVLAVPLLWPYYAVAHERPHPPTWGFKAADLVTPARDSYLYDSLDESAEARADRSEHTFFPGFATYALGAVGLGVLIWGSVRRARSDRPPPDDIGGVRADRRLYVWLLLAAAAVSVVLAIGPEAGGVTMPFNLLREYVPGFGGIRVAARLAIPGLLTLAVLASVGFAALTKRLRASWACIATIATAGFVLLELAAPRSLHRLPTDQATVAVYERLADKSDGAVVELPVMLYGPDPRRIKEATIVEATRMLYATRDWKSRFNGYSGDWPETYFTDASVLNSFPSPEALATIRRLGIRYVVLHVGEHVGYPQMTEQAAAKAVSELPPGFQAARHGKAWLLEVSQAE